MAVGVKHNKVCGGENDPSKEVSRDAWNEYHVIEGMGTAAEASVEDFEPAGSAAAAVAAHEAANDPHPSYLKQAEADALYAGTSHAHSYNDLDDKPTLGDAAAKNVGTGAGEVAAGDHTHPGGSEAFPVGSVFIAVVSTNPGTLLGYGTWSAFGAGKMMVGIDSGDTDLDTVEETGGAKTVTLTAAQSGLPQHTHTQNAHTHDFLPRSGTSGSVSSIVTGTLDTSSTISGANQPHVQSATAVNQNAGPADAAQAHNNMPPFIVVYLWKRTA